MRNTVLADLIASCLAKEPSARPTAEQLAARLDELADALGTPSVDAVAGEAATVGVDMHGAPTWTVAPSGLRTTAVGTGHVDRTG